MNHGLKQTPWICPSILSADFSKLGEEINSVMNAGAHRIHIDVMDNHYVPNLSFGPLVCESLRAAGITAPMDVHLMVEPVDGMIKNFLEVGVDCIVFHPEASKHVDRSLNLIRSGNISAGLVLNPASPIYLLDPVWDYLDRILLMSVNPGFGGQKFIPSVLNKARELRKLIDQRGRPIRLEIDGGVNLDNIKIISDAGVDTFVMGNAIYKSGDKAGDKSGNYQQVFKNIFEII